MTAAERFPIFHSLIGKPQARHAAANFAIRMALTLSLCVGLTFAAPTAAQAPATVDPAALLDTARKDMDAARAATREGADDASMVEGRRLALEAQTQAEAAAAALGTELAAVQARLAELGAPAAGVKESPEVAAQRAQLTKAQTALDSQARLARLLSVEAEQAAASARSQRRSRFNAELFARTPAVTSSEFWDELRKESPADARRLEMLFTDLGARFASVSAGVWLAALAGFVLLLFARKPAEALALRLILARTPAGRLRRSLHALGRVLIWTSVPGLAIQALYWALTSQPGLSEVLRELLGGFAAIVWFGAFCASLGMALLMPGKPSWRLPPISDQTASRLRWFPPALAFSIVLGWWTTRLTTAADASLASTVALRSLGALTILLLMMAAVLQIRRSRRAQRAADIAEREEKAAGVDKPGKADHPVLAPGTALWIPTLGALASVALIATLLGLLSGYVALGTFVMNQAAWALIVASVAYFLAVVVDDLLMAFLAPTAPPQEATTKAATTQQQAPQPQTREQTAVLLSGAFRVALIVVAIVLLLAPFGEGPTELFRRADRVSEGISIGEVQLLPATLLQGALVLVVGLFAVRALKIWLADKFMPTTRMDAGLRMSVTTLLGYVGSVIVVALSMSAVGVGLERVAWVASALSVGIGFGLQAVVQNFVSGLILLAERPVKVGDWVSLGGVEGDIRRINVRATEIQMGDRSTVIVPNSEFITKIVRNVTYTDPIGMVQIKLPMPIATDARKAKDVILDAFLAHAGVLETPKPNVQLDGIDGLNLVFNATGFVSSPRASYGVKSDLLFDVLDRLREAGLELARAPTMVLSAAVAEPGAAGLPQGVVAA